MSFYVTILGSSSAVPTSKRNLAAQVINHLERLFLIDCGEGTQMQLRKFHIKFTRLNHIFISHLHADHVMGLPGLLSTYSILGRTQPLHIYADPRLESYLSFHQSFFYEQMSFQVVFHPIQTKQSEVIFEDDRLCVSTIPLKHRIPCVGFLFREKPQPRKIKKECIALYKLSIKDIQEIKGGSDFFDGEKWISNEELTFDPPPIRSYAYCSDTRPLKEIIPYIEGVDALYHEATFLEEDTELAKKTYHSTTVDVAQLAVEAKVGKLIIGHFSSRYNHEGKFLEETMKIFPATLMAEDGLRIDIG
ncbi:MAG: ribonuclease Z [Bacteroidales bacterium]|nr:ribonuclease Z [Bacteroidales bacterium]